MATTTSKDGTTIAYERIGEGPAVVLVDGALCYRASGPARPLAEKLSQHYAVYIYDRRGRGETGDTQPFDTEREVEDLEAVIGEAGGSVYLYAISSGVPLALAAVKHGADVKKQALYEFPLIVDDSRSPVPADYQKQLNALIAADKRGAAVKHFMRRGVGMPAALVALFGLFPGWSKLKRVAPTLAYDAAAMGDALDGKPLPSGRYDFVKVPTIVIAGSKSPEWMRNGNEALAAAIPEAEHRVLEGQTHMVKAEALAPVLTEFFAE